MPPRWLLAVGSCVAVAGLIPFTFIAEGRVATSTKPRLHVIRDMDNMERFKAQQENPLFADKRAMRAPIPGTVARGELREDTHLEQGRISRGDKLVFTDELPASIAVDDALLDRGRKGYEVFCAACHGYSGYGDGMVHERVMALKKRGADGMEGWAAPASFHTIAMQIQPAGYLFHVVTNGVRNMAGYRSQIPVEDRWAIVAYVRALQLSQGNR